MRLWLAILLSVLPTSSVLAQSQVWGSAPPENNAQNDADASDPVMERVRMFENVGRLLSSMRELGDWEEQQGYIMDAATRVYEQNGWNSPEDQFSLQVIQDVGAIPPWRPRDRLDRVIDVFGQRYGLDADQEVILRDLIQRESQAVFQKHSGAILQYAVEAVQTRAAGDPITPEQVARWTDLAMPVVLDSRAGFDEAAEEFMQYLSPEQQAQVRQDLAAHHRRQDAMLKMGERWRNGEWSAADWGLDADPIQAAGEARLAAERDAQAIDGPRPETPKGPTNPPGKTQPPTTKPTTDDPWATYVRGVIAKYSLTDAQQRVAWRVYEDMKTQRDIVKKRYGKLIEQLEQRFSKEPTKASAAKKKYESQQEVAVDKMFDQLKKRVDRVPTTAQRRAAEAADKSSPTEPRKSEEKPK